MQHYAEFTDSLLKSRQIDIQAKITHIYFSFILAFAILSNLLVSIDSIANKYLKWGNALLAFLNLLLLHVIASRTGLLAFYVTFLITIIFWGLKKRKYLALGAILLVTVGLLAVSMAFFSSLRIKVNNTVQDVHAYVTGQNTNYWPLSMRFEAWGKAYKVFKSSPVIGVGKGDVIPQMKELFNTEGTLLLDENRKDPHNQYLYELASSGIIGFSIFILLLLLPLKNIIKREDYLSLMLLVVMMVSFSSESVLERQWGVTFFAFFWCYLLYRSDLLCREATFNT
jgi:O-antigen ligase